VGGRARDLTRRRVGQSVGAAAEAAAVRLTWIGLSKCGDERGLMCFGLLIKVSGKFLKRSLEQWQIAH